MPPAAPAEHAAETRRRGGTERRPKRIEVRRPGVGSNAGPHFLFQGLLPLIRRKWVTLWAPHDRVFARFVKKTLSFIASAAKQSSDTRETLDCFAALAMTTLYGSNPF